ncbi:spermidine synthase [Thermosphaera chiliense]|uniref:Polyamine aminopropyltransferase n=1 Tax=Thermosphaera chiliense TaxID=3402707 RepID=A0A7M1UPG7_9CREN|nr:spermidine synthase [Thermosphaera aggregans]QOR94101.1 spermidine synthase [Thermosphaera aggregans]
MSEEGFYLVEPAGKSLKCLFKIKRVLALEKTPYQEIAFADLEGFGKSLIIDNYVQSTETDEHFYHELLVQPAMTLHPNPKRVLIIGGGEGATLREVLKHKTVEEAVMVDIDEKVVEFSKKYLEHMHRGSFDDPRSKVIIMDGFEYVRKAPQKYFDVVIMDLTDPYAGETAKALYSSGFYSQVKKIMADNSVLVTQAGSSYFYPDEYKYVLTSLSRNFGLIGEYWTWIPSFGLNVNFIIASDTINPWNIDPIEFDKRLQERGVQVKYVTGKRFLGLLLVGVVYPY